MKIYTRGGDRGETSLFGGRRLGKDALRVSSYGEIDELNAFLGLARAEGSLDEELSLRLARVQGELFTLGAQLAAPDAGENVRVPKTQAAWAELLEREIDAADSELPALRHFVLPGGAPGASWLHVARTVCRRAERSVVALSRTEAVSSEVLVYLNRLSDWLFTMARLANHRAGVAEPTWSGPR